MIHTVRRGETLSAIAQQHRLTLEALRRSNPRVTNPHQISPGQTLDIPGRRDSFQPAPVRSGTASSTGTGGMLGAVGKTVNGVTKPVTGPVSGGGSSPYNIARQYLGQNASTLKVSNSQVGRLMENWVPNNVNCANFVSSCLQAAGQLKGHDNSVAGLRSMLDRSGNFKRVGLSQAQPGDVVTMQTGKNAQHVVMFAGWQNGKPQFIGSNNINPDGSQRVSQKGMNYPIVSVQHFVG